MAKSSASLEQLAIGIDIGGTGTKFGIVDRNGNILFSSEISTRGHGEIEGYIDELHRCIPKSGLEYGGGLVSRHGDQESELLFAQGDPIIMRSRCEH